MNFAAAAHQHGLEHERKRLDRCTSLFHIPDAPNESRCQVRGYFCRSLSWLGGYCFSLARMGRIMAWSRPGCALAVVAVEITYKSLEVYSH